MRSTVEATPRWRTVVDYVVLSLLLLSALAVARATLFPVYAVGFALVGLFYVGFVLFIVTQRLRQMHFRTHE